jgi:calcium/proton exchanger cax
LATRGGVFAAISLTVPSAFSRFFAPGETLRAEALLNVGLAIVLLAAYALYLVFMLKTHPDEFAGETGASHADHGPRWSLARAVGSLLVASLLAAWMSEILVGAAEGTGTALGMSQVLIGIVFPGLPRRTQPAISTPSAVTYTSQRLLAKVRRQRRLATTGQNRNEFWNRCT